MGGAECFAVQINREIWACLPHPQPLVPTAIKGVVQSATRLFGGR